MAKAKAKKTEKWVQVPLDALDIELRQDDIALIERVLPNYTGAEHERLSKKLATMKQELAQGFWLALED